MTVERIAVGATVAGIAVEALVAEHGSPLYVYDAEVIRRRVAALRAALPPAVDVAFATKANGSPAVLRLMADLGLGADVASGGELAAVLRAGTDPARVVFTGPGKTDAELAAALRAGIGVLTIESLDELESVVELAPEAAAGQGLVLRLATEGREDRPIIGGAGAAKFGLTDDEADEAIGQLRAGSLLSPDGPFRLRGFHAFGASNVTDAVVLLDGLGDLAGRAEQLARRHDLDIELLDAGGGLGIPYIEGGPSLDLETLGAGVAAELATWPARAPLRDARLLLEPGRWLTGPAGVFLCSVVRTKARAGRDLAITDGGIHHLLRPRLVGQDHRVVPVGQTAARTSAARVDVVGPLCTGIDVLATDVRAPTPRRDDTYAILDAGAYGYSESMPLFLSHPTPAEIIVDAGVVTVSRSRIEPAMASAS